MSEPRLLLVGPFPPPLGGAAVSTKILADEILTRLPRRVSIVDTSPKRLRTQRTIRPREVIRAADIAGRMFWGAHACDAMLALVTDGFYFRFSWLFSLIQRRLQKPIIISFFGGQLADELRTLDEEFRATLISRLVMHTAVIVETDYLADNLRGLGLSRVTTVPGYRRLPAPSVAPILKRREGLRLVFVGTVKRTKGIGVLMEAVRNVNKRNRANRVSLDIYGPVDETTVDCSQLAVAGDASVRYLGVLEDDPVALLRGYDALALPTFHEGEGHPGVIIEAMIAGIPVISTRFRAIPELVQDGFNGLLVQPGSVEELENAIAELSNNPELRAVMGRNQAALVGRHSVSSAAERILALLGMPQQ